MSEPLLVVEDLVIEIANRHGNLRAVDGVSFTVGAGEAVGLVGESGSGKSLTLKAIMGLLPNAARVRSGRVLFQGQDLTALSSRRLAALRGTGLSMVFQEPSTALNPVMRVGPQIVDGVARRMGWRHHESKAHAIELMRVMGIPDPDRRYGAYPHELSGGMRQRIMIAAALAGEPALILCDEPTTALDVTIQHQIVTLLAGLQTRLGTGLLYVTHDLAVVAQLCDRVEVMYGGQLLESAAVRTVFDVPAHPYSLGLLRATPTLDGDRARLTAIPGAAPGLDELPDGCRFAPRCAFADEQCTGAPIDWVDVGERHRVRCVRPEVTSGSHSVTAGAR